MPGPRRRLRVLSGPLSNFHDLAANDATTALIINVITAVGQYQRLQNELTAEGIVAAEAEGRYRGRPPALTGTQLEEARSAFTDQGASIAALARAHGVSRAAVRTTLADLLPGQSSLPSRSAEQHAAVYQVDRHSPARTSRNPPSDPRPGRRPPQAPGGGG